MKNRTGYLFKRNARYYVRYAINGAIKTTVLRDDTGQAISTLRDAEIAREKLMAPLKCADKIQALQSIADQIKGLEAQLATLRAQQNPLTLSKAWVNFVESPKRRECSKATMRQYTYQFNRLNDWITKNYGQLPITGITSDIAEQFAGALNTGPNTFNKHVQLYAYIWRTLKLENPWTDIQAKRLTTESRHEFTVDQLKVICSTATGELKTLFAIGLYTGLRLGDCATLRWSEVDLTKGLITRLPNKTAKSRKPVVIPIHSVLLGVLNSVATETKSPFVLPGYAEKYSRGCARVTSEVQAHLKACGIQTTQANPGKRATVLFGFHSLRHTFVSLCAEAGTAQSVVQSIVGHSSPAMTLHYTHTSQRSATAAIATLPTLT